MATPYFQSYSPRCRVKVLDPITGKELADLSKNILSLSTNKGYARGAGTWQAMLQYKLVDSWHQPGQDFYNNIIKPDDIITIELNHGDGTSLIPVMFGLVDRASVVRMGGIKPVRQVKLSGQDVGKLLQKHDIGWDISGVGAQTGSTSQLTIQQQTTASEQGVSRMIQSYLARLAFKAGTAEELIKFVFGLFQDVLDNFASVNTEFKSTTDDLWTPHNPNGIYNQGMNAWEAMRAYSHAPYNMLHADTAIDDVQTYNITLEKNPITAPSEASAPVFPNLFNAPTLNLLSGGGKVDRSNKGIDVHQITDTDIIHDDLGISDAERINVLAYWPALYAIDPLMTLPIIMANTDLTKTDIDSIERHGYCPHIINDTFFPPQLGVCINDNPTGTTIQAAIDRAAIFWEWFKNNHTYESGIIQTHLMPKVRAGHCLVIKQADTETYKEYFVEQVSHQCVLDPRPAFMTTFQVTRGQTAAPGKLQ